MYAINQTQFVKINILQSGSYLNFTPIPKTTKWSLGSSNGQFFSQQTNFLFSLLICIFLFFFFFILISTLFSYLSQHLVPLD